MYPIVLGLGLPFVALTTEPFNVPQQIPSWQANQALIAQLIRAKPRSLTLTSPLLTLTGHQGGVTDLAVSPDGKTLVSSGDDGTLRFWDIRSGDRLRVVKGDRSKITGLALSQDGRLLASASVETVKLWNFQTGAAIGDIGRHPTLLRPVALSPDGQILVTVGDRQFLEVWETTAQVLIQTISLPPAQDNILTLTFSPNGQLLISASYDTIQIWDGRTAKLLQTLNAKQVGIYDIAISSDGNMLASVDKAGSLQIWDLKTATLTKTLQNETGGFVCVALSPDGKLVAANYGDGEVAIWSLQTGDRRFILQKHTQPVSTLTFTPDGKSLISGSGDGTIKIWNVE